MKTNLSMVFWILFHWSVLENCFFNSHWLLFLINIIKVQLPERGMKSVLMKDTEGEDQASADIKTTLGIEDTSGSVIT